MKGRTVLLVVVVVVVVVRITASFDTNAKGRELTVPLPIVQQGHKNESAAQ